MIYIYIRVSTLTQADNFSLDAQREKRHKYAEYQDMIIAGEYADEGFAADVLYSLQLMQDFGVNLICVGDGLRG